MRHERRVRIEFGDEVVHGRDGDGLRGAPVRRREREHGAAPDDRDVRVGAERDVTSAIGSDVSTTS